MAGPAIQRGNDLAKIVAALVENVEIGQGLRGKDSSGNYPNRYVTVNDLVTAGVVALKRKTGQKITFPSNDEFVVPLTGPLDYSIPPAPTGLTATAGMAQILVEWNQAPSSYWNPAYTEIWRNGTNDLGTATRVTTVPYPSNIFSDPIGATGVAEYYWGRYVSQSDTAGPFNAVSGVAATTGKVGNADLSPLIVTADKLASGVNAVLDVAGLPTLPNTNYPAGTLVADTTNNRKIYKSTGSTWDANIIYAGNLAAGTIVAGDGAISNLAITNALIGTAAVDDAKIANMSVAKLTAGTITAANIYVGDSHLTLDGTAGNVRVSDGTYNRVKLGNLGSGAYGIEIRDASNNIILSSGGTYGSAIDNASVTTLSLVSTDSAKVVPAGNTITNVNGSGWSQKCYSKAAYTGGAFCSFTPTQTNKAYVIGLNSDPTTTGFASIDYGIYVDASGVLEVVESGTTTSFGSYAAGDVLTVVYDGTKIYYLQNQSIVKTTSVAGGLTLYFDSTWSTVGGMATNISFGPMTSNAWASIGGTGKPADNATKNTVTTGSAAPSGGTDGDLYYRTSNSAWYSKLSGVWTQVSDVTAANTAAAISGQGAFATLSQINSGNVSTYIASAAIGYAQIGSIDASTITVGTLTGRTMQTASSGQRCVMSSSTNDFRSYDSGSTLRAAVGFNVSGNGEIGYFEGGTGYHGIYAHSNDQTAIYGESGYIGGQFHGTQGALLLGVANHSSASGIGGNLFLDENGQLSFHNGSAFGAIPTSNSGSSYSTQAIASASFWTPAHGFYFLTAFTAGITLQIYNGSSWVTGLTPTVGCLYWADGSNLRFTAAGGGQSVNYRKLTTAFG